jgi:hypothetical protein
MNLLDHQIRIPSESDGPVGQGVLEEAGGHVEVVEAGGVALEPEDVVTDAVVGVVVFLEIKANRIDPDPLVNP